MSILRIDGNRKRIEKRIGILIGKEFDGKRKEYAGNIMRLEMSRYGKHNIAKLFLTG